MPMWIYDRSSLRILEVNDTAVALYGYGRDAFLELSIADLGPADEAGRAEAVPGRSPGSTHPAGVRHHRLADGRVIDVEVAGHALEYAGRPAALVVAHDVTDRRRAEIALRESEERYRLAAETVSDAIVSVDDRGHVVFANYATEAIFGWLPAELTGRPLTVLMPGRLRPAHRRAFERFRRTGVRTRSWHAAAATGLHRDGHEFPIEISLGEILTGAGHRFTSFIRDVSGRERLEEQLRQLQKMEGIGQLAGGIAHDFNNILTAIRGYADLLASELGPEDPRQDSVRGIQEAGERAAELTGKLLTFSRQQVARTDVLHLRTVVEDIGPLLGRVLGEHIELQTHLRAEGHVRGDRGQLELVVINLAVNASDAMPDGGRLTIETDDVDLDSAFVAAHPGVHEGPHVLLAVSDTGVGMDAATRARIFEPFFTTKPEGKGTGLGLATVYGIVRQAGGAVWVYSEPGTGSTFKVHLPRVDAPLDEAARSPGPADAPIPTGREGHEIVVIVEDDSAVRALAAGALRRLGYAVRDYADPLAAVRDLERAENRPDLIVTDAMMPGMSGRELVARARGAHPGLPALFVSGFTRDAAGPGAPEGDEFLAKPFAVSELARRVRALLDAGGG